MFTDHYVFFFGSLSFSYSSLYNDRVKECTINHATSIRKEKQEHVKYLLSCYRSIGVEITSSMTVKRT